MKNKNNLSLLGVSIISLFLFSCNGILKKGNEKLVFEYDRTQNEYSPFYSFLKHSQSFELIASQWYGALDDPLKDTLVFTQEDFDKCSCDTISIEKEFRLGSFRKLSVEELEAFLVDNDFNINKLKENLYWLARVERSELIVLKNSFGDITGYYLKTPEGNFVPPSYYKVIKDVDPFTNEIKHSVYAECSMIAEKKYKDYLMHVKLCITNSLVSSLRNNADEFDDRPLGIVLDVDSESSIYYPGENKELSCIVYIRTYANYLRNGNYHTVLDFSPFSITRID